jgi:hypothetical protein
MNLSEIWFFINPFPMMTSVEGWIDLVLLIGIPTILLRNFWKGLLVFIGFMLTQINVPGNPWTELVLEVIGLVIMILVCKGTKKDVGKRRDKRRKSPEIKTRINSSTLSSLTKKSVGWCFHGRFINPEMDVGFKYA